MEKDLKEELLRVRAREKRYRNTAEAQIASLQKQLEITKEVEVRAESTRIDLENRCRKLEEENGLLQKRADSFQEQRETTKSDLCSEFRQKLELAEEEARKLREKLSTLNDAAAAADSLQGQPQDIREILRAQGYAVDNLATFFAVAGIWTRFLRYGKLCATW